MITPRLLPFLILLAAVPALSACGDGDGLTAAALADAADTTAAKGSVRMSMQQTMAIPGEGTIPSTAEGVFDTKSKRGEMTVSTDLSSIPGAGSIGGDASKQRVVFDGLVFYMTSPLFEQALPGAKKWMKIDLAKAGKELGVDFEALMQNGGGGQDPTQSLQYLKAASGDVEEVGTETVRGTSTTHYKATIDFDKVADSAPADQRAAVRRSMRQLIKLAGASTAPMEVWLAGDGTVRRLKQTITTKIAGQRSTMTQRMEFFDFGTKADIEIPKAAEVVDASELGGALQDGVTAGALSG